MHPLSAPQGNTSGLMADDRLVALEFAKLAMVVAPPLNEQEFFAMYRRCLTVIRRSARRSPRIKYNGATVDDEDKRRVVHELTNLLESQGGQRQL
jgi:hypothetical protein